MYWDTVTPYHTHPKNWNKTILLLMGLEITVSDRQREP